MFIEKWPPRDTNMASKFPFNIAHVLSNFDTLGKKIHKGEELYIFFGTQMQLFINGLKKVFFCSFELRALHNLKRNELLIMDVKENCDKKKTFKEKFTLMFIIEMRKNC